VSYRAFRDSAGTLWEVWEVQPALLERRLLSELPVDIDRRTEPGKRAPVAEELRFGWLVFQSEESKRRLAPIPRDWETLDGSGLIGLLDRAEARDRPRVALSGDDSMTSPPVQSISTRLT
jgi:hypothetical protein